ncbi:hypothetical protein ALC56_09175 [Trachymyrmex septentrionalis]|uniref:Uncharacterized protein n=1 Tax=Trachymyrmex septentrionalis TaxID=34720 RepID=A0A195F6J0_9HYME|nr:hypothetical protein ALC56_09175 [Trachymyrmex septentrionalis]
MYELRMSSVIKATIKSRLDAEETRFIVSKRIRILLGSYKGSYSVPTRSSRRQQVLAFGALGKGRNFGPGRTRDGHRRSRFLGITPRFFTRWQHLDGAFRCRELRLVSLEMCSELDVREADGGSRAKIFSFEFLSLTFFIEDLYLNFYILHVFFKAFKDNIFFYKYTVRCNKNMICI